MNIDQAVATFQHLIERAILQGGQAGITSAIRSSTPIHNIHNAVKHELVRNGVYATSIFPPIGQRTPELHLCGAIKPKNQDVCVVPPITRLQEILTECLFENVVDDFGEDYTKKTLAINVRSQLSSINKNFDTLLERTVSEASNFHERCPEMVLGEIYLLAVPEYLDLEFRNRTVKFKPVQQFLVEKYIQSFKRISGRVDVNNPKHLFKYEKACLLIVDFRSNTPVIHHTTASLKQAGFLSNASTTTIEEISWVNFIPDLCNIYKARFGTGIFKP